MKKSEITLFLGVGCGLAAGIFLLKYQFLLSAGALVFSIALFTSAFRQQKRGR